MACLNPVITARSEATQVGLESCLSVPDYNTLVRRAVRIEVTYYTYAGLPLQQLVPDAATAAVVAAAAAGGGALGDVVQVREEWHGLPAVVFQHEHDHLDGVLLTDREMRAFVRRPRAAEEREAIKLWAEDYERYYAAATP